MFQKAFTFSGLLLIAGAAILFSATPAQAAPQGGSYNRGYNSAYKNNFGLSTAAYSDYRTYFRPPDFYRYYAGYPNYSSYNPYYYRPYDDGYFNYGLNYYRPYYPYSSGYPYNPWYSYRY